MIDTNLTIEKIDGEYRDVIAFTFAKWFDEPFTVDVINRMQQNGITCELCSKEEDRNHSDYRFNETFIGVSHTADSKTYSHNYPYKDNNGVQRKADLVTIGEHAMNSETEYISVVHDSSIHLIKLDDIRSHEPVWKDYSKGQNNRPQLLYRYDIEDMKLYENTINIGIRKEMAQCYTDAYELYNKYHRKAQNMKHRVNFKYSQYFDLSDEFALDLKPIIERFNNIYDEVPKVQIEENLDEIYSLLS